MSVPGDTGTPVPADGEIPDGRIVVPADDAAGRADPQVYGDGLARLLDAVATEIPRAEVDSVWAFPGVQREGREYGVAVVTRRGEGERLRVYRARYTLHVKGQDRGKAVIEVEETAAAPPEMMPQVLEGVRRRADEAGDAELVDLGPWLASAPAESGG